MTNITLDTVLSRSCCYTPERLTILYATPVSPLDVLTRTDGEWGSVSHMDRVWTVCYHGCIDEVSLRLFACRCARRTFAYAQKEGRVVDPRRIRAVDIAEATVGEMKEARIFDTVRAHDYAYTTAVIAAIAAAYAAYDASATADSLAADIAIQVHDLIEMLTTAQKETP